MKLSYSEQIIPGLTLGDVVAYSRKSDLSLLKGNDPINIAKELYEKDSLSQADWKALKLLNCNLFNRRRAQSYKAVFKAKYGYLVKKMRSHTAIAVPSQELFKGIHECIRHKSDLPYYQEFYNDYFLVYDIDSIIDMAYTFSEEEKDMCKTLLIASCQYYRDNRLHINSPNSQKSQEGKTIDLSNAYLDIRYKDDIWSDENKVVEYLKDHYAEDIKNASFPMDGFLATKSIEKKLKREFKDFNAGFEKKRFLMLAQEAQEELIMPQSIEVKPKDNTEGELESSKNVETNNNISVAMSHIGASVVSGSSSIHDTTNIEVLDTPITDSAKEVTLNIAMRSKTTSKQKVKKENVRPKDDVDYSEQQLISQKIGDRGEELVLRNEIKKVKEWGLSDDIISQVRRVSLESDDYGFDILSFDEDGNERYLEVKTTKQNRKNFSFILTRNEFEHAKAYGNKYSFVIVFDILNQPRIWYMENPFLQEPYKVSIQPTQYRVDVSTAEL